MLVLKKIWKKIISYFAKDLIEKQQLEYNTLKAERDELEQKYKVASATAKYLNESNDKLIDELDRRSRVINLFGTLEDHEVTVEELTQFKKLAVMANTSLAELEKDNIRITESYENLKKNNELSPYDEAKKDNNEEIMKKFRFMTQCINNIVKKLEGII